MQFIKRDLRSLSINSKSFVVFLFFVSKTRKIKGLFFECSPEITSLDYTSLNSTLSIRCAFRKHIENPADVIWRFSLGGHGHGKSERIINPLDGPTLEPFRHELVQVNGSWNGLSDLAAPNHIKTLSILHIRLLNSSYYTNYSLSYIGDTCLVTVRVHLQETGA